jgi:protein SERAC1
MGTPHHGSGLAHWAEGLAKTIGVLKQTNPEILAVLRSDSEVLARVQDAFHTMIRSRAQVGQLRPIEITCFFEELPLPGVGIVSSALLPFVGNKKLILFLGCSVSLCHSTRIHPYRDTE